MRKTIYLLALIVALAACKTQKTSTTPSKKQKNVTEATIDDFANVLGLQKDDLFARATQLLGQPTTSTKDKNDTYSFISCYYDDVDGNRMFSYTYDKKPMR